MAVLYYRFKCAKDFRSLVIPGNYISVGELKDLIFATKLQKGKDFDLIITNAQTNEDYVDESSLISANSSVLIRRLPGWPRKPIVIGPVAEADKQVLCLDESSSSKSTVVKSAAAAVSILDSEEFDEFFADISSSGSNSSTLTTVTDDEDAKIKALVDTPALGSYGGAADAMGKRMTGRNIPPVGYLCHRCKVAGHFIQHCPTNGDPEYDVKKVRDPRGVPKSMLVANPDGLYKLEDGKVAELKPDEASFEKEIEGIPTMKRCVVAADIPSELYCKICKKVMEYAVISSKCCLDSFCDECIRNYIISSSNGMCYCGAKSILTDYLVPNLTLRKAINRLMEYDNCGVKNENNKAIPHAKVSATSKKREATLVASDTTVNNGEEVRKEKKRRKSSDMALRYQQEEMNMKMQMQMGCQVSQNLGAQNSYWAPPPAAAAYGFSNWGGIPFGVSYS